MVTLLKNMLKSKEFLDSVVTNENVTCHIIKVLMMKCGYNKILISIFKLMINQMKQKKIQNNLYMTVMSYINKYG